MTLDPTLVDRICDLLLQGCSVRTTCECVGISESTFFEYMRRGKPASTTGERSAPSADSTSERLTAALAKVHPRSSGPGTVRPR